MSNKYYFPEQFNSNQKAPIEQSFLSVDPTRFVPRRLCRRDPGSFQNFFLFFSALWGTFQKPFTFFGIRQSIMNLAIDNIPRTLTFCGFNQSIIMFLYSLPNVFGYSYITYPEVDTLKNIEIVHKENFGNCLGTLVSLGANANMLLHTIRARVHDFKGITKKTPLARNLFCSTPLGPIYEPYWHCIINIAKPKIMSRSCQQSSKCRNR